MRTVFAFLLLVSFCLPSLSEESSPRESENKAEATQSNDQHGSAAKQIPVPANSPVPTIINIQTGKHSGHERECAKPKDWKEWPAFAWCKIDNYWDAERTIAAFTVILAISTTFLWWSTRKLWIAGEKQLRHARRSIAIQSRDMRASIEASIQSAEAAQVSAKASVDSFYLARDTAINTQRAFLVLTGMSAEPVCNDATLPELIGQGLQIPDGHSALTDLQIMGFWQNTGTTPALNINIWQQVQLVDPDTNPDDIVFFKNPRIGARSLTIGPGVKISGARHLVRRSDLIEAAEGRKCLYVWSLAEYHDFFTGTPLRHTELCTQVFVVRNIPKTLPVGQANPPFVDFLGVFTKYNRVD